MPKPKDRVQISKQESAGGGGTAEDDFDFLNHPLDANQDAPDLAGIYVQESGAARDKQVVVYRENNELYFEDNLNSGINRLSLTDLTTLPILISHNTTHSLGGGDDLIVQDLGSGTTASGLLIETNGGNGWNLISTTSVSKVKISSTDTIPRYLSPAIEVDGLIKTIKNPGADETLELKVDGAGISPFTIRINPENLTTSGNHPKHIIANGYSALEFIKGSTNYGAWSDIWTRIPGADVELNVKFILRGSQAGTVVRIAARVKCRANGEDTSTNWNEEKVHAVTVNTTNIGDVFEANMIFSKNIFDINDAVAIQIGRDGFEQVSPITPVDDFNEKIQIIAINLRIP